MMHTHLIIAFGGHFADYVMYCHRKLFKFTLLNGKNDRKEMKPKKREFPSPRREVYV